MEISWSQRKHPGQQSTPRHSGWLDFDPDSSSDEASASPSPLLLSRGRMTPAGGGVGGPRLGSLQETVFSRRVGSTPSGMQGLGGDRRSSQAGGGQHRRAFSSSTRRASSSSSDHSPEAEWGAASFVHEGSDYDVGASASKGDSSAIVGTSRERRPRQPIFENDEDSSSSDREAGKGGAGRKHQAGDAPGARQRSRRAGELGRLAGGPLRRINRLQAILDHALESLADGLEDADQNHEEHVTDYEQHVKRGSGSRPAGQR